jgi:hypothetical protein
MIELVRGNKAPNPIAAIMRKITNVIEFPEKEVRAIAPEYINKAQIRSFFGEDRVPRKAQRNEKIPDTIKNSE